MRFADVPKCGFDTETTGVDVREARIVTAALIVPGAFTRTVLIDPEIEISAEASEIHGITTDVARADGIPAVEGVEWIASNLCEAIKRHVPVVAFNLSYDWSVLHYELLRHGLPTMVARFGEPIEGLIDPYVLDKGLDKYRRGSRKLQPTCEHYGIDEITDWHTADADAYGAILIAEKLFERYPYLNSWSPSRLFNTQARWKKQQCEGLEAYFRNEGKSGEKYDPNAVVNVEWPLQTVPEGSEKESWTAVKV